MAAITDPDEIAQAQAQLAAQGATPSAVMAPATAAPASGPIMDPGEIAQARAALNAAMTPSSTPPATTAPPIPTMQAMPNRGPMGAVADTVRMLTNKIPFADRFAAEMQTLTGTGLPGADYAKNLANERAQNQWLDTQHPILSKVLGLGGGAAGIMATLPEDAAVAAGAAPTMAARALTGAATGGVYGGIQGASETPDLSNLPQAAKNIATGAVVGAGTGGAVPIIAGGIGSAYAAGANTLTGGAEGISRRAASHLLPAIAADTPQAVQSTLDELGNQGMLADAGPSLLGKAQGAALNSEEGRAVMGNALAARNAGTNARLGTDVNAALGPAISPQQATDILQNARGQVHALLPRVFAQAPPVDTTDIVANIGKSLNKAVGPEAAVLGKARSYLMQPAVDEGGNATVAPVTDAETLQNAKMALDTLIDRGDPTLGVMPGAISKSQGSVANIRQQLNQVLRDQVPGYAQIMDKSSALASRMEAIEKGNSILSSGQNALSPEDLQSQLATTAAKGMGSISPVINQLQGLRIGARGAIDRAMGTKSNDLVALSNALQGEGGWNAAKLGTIFGQQPASDIADSVARNQAFRNTFQNVVQNSQTAQRTAAAAAMKPGASTGGIPYLNPNMTLTGAMMTPVKALGNALLSPLKSNPTQSYGEMARVLTAQGPQRDAYLSALLDALNRRAKNAAVGQALGNRSALSAALIGGQAVNDRLQGQ